MHRIPLASENEGHDVCPFCAQDLRCSPIIEHDRAYFGESYAALKRDIEQHLSRIQTTHGGDVPAAFERSVRVWEQRRNFWKDFTAVPEIQLDTAEIARAWKTARDAILADLQKKKSAPLGACRT